MRTNIRTRARVRAVAAAVVFAGATFAVTASPVSLPRPEALKPAPVLAAFCGSNAAFTGRLTATSSSTTAVARTKSATVYGYISSVSSAWSCTAFYRYSGIVWNTAATTGRFDWGNLINSTAVACNFVVGSTDYIKANSTTDCPDTDAEYALAATLDAQRVYQADAAHNGTGDFSFAHSDCGTYYGAEPIKTGQDFAGATVGNRPGSNCDALTLDSTGTTQTITYDSTLPTVAITVPAAGGPVDRNSTAYTVTFNPTDNLSNFGGTNIWKLQRQIASITSANVCGTFANDTATGNLVTGTVEGSQTNAQTLLDNKCYRWTLTATDQNGNGPATTTSGTVLVDLSAPVAAFTAPSAETTINILSYAPTWTMSDAQSGTPTTSLQRQKVAATSSACPGTFANDGAASSSASGTSYTLVTGNCYQWVLTVTNGAGTPTTITSAKVYVDASSPSANFTTPDEGTTTIQNVTTYSVGWTEAAGTGFTITGRSLQRQTGAIVTSGTCAGVSWADDGAPVTTVSPVAVTGLVDGQCYRWIQTLTNSAPKNGATTSGSVLVDTTASAGTIAYPEANRPLAGDVVTTGSATDASSFQNYQLEYGSGTAPASWTTIGSISTTQVAATGTLGTWSTAGLSGVYTLRLTVRDLAANTSSVTTRTVILENAQRGDEAFFSRVPFDLGGGYGLDIGVANGEARLSRSLFSIPSYGPPGELGLTYSSAETATTGRFGAGWLSNLTQYLTFDATNLVTWHRSDGGRVPFGNIAGTWTPLRGHFETFGTGSGVYTITTKDQTKLTFESTGAGRLTKIENRFGKALTLAWSTSSATATDASGRVTTLAIDSVNSRITGATDSAGRAWAFGYTGTGTASDLTSITDPAGKVTTLAYDASHHLTTVTRSRSRVAGAAQTITWTVGYTTGKATSVSDPDSAPTASTFTYGAGTTTAALLKAVTGPVRTTTTYTIDALGRVTSLVDPEGLTSSMTYDVDSNVLTQTSPIDGSASFTTTWTYDGRGNVLTETVPIDAATSVTTVHSYSATNDLLTRSEADNDSSIKLVTLYTYDGTGHLTSTNVNCTTSGTTPPATASTCTGAGTQDAATNLITSYAYSANDQLAFEQDPLGRVTKHAYDTYGTAGATFGLETSVTANCTTSGTSAPSPFSSCTGGGTPDAQTNVTSSTVYDQSLAAGKAGLPTSTTDPLGNTITLTYDALGRQLTEVLPGDASIPALTRTTTYDELGNVLTSVESWTPLGGGSAIARTTTHVYDLSNRETSLTDAAGIVTTTTYDAAGNAITTISDGVQTSRTFDGLGRTLTETLAGVGVTSHAYDGQGNEVSTSTPDGVLTLRTFSLTGWNLTETVDPTGGALLTQHTYDRLGRELTSTDPTGTSTTTTYDRTGRSLTVTTAGSTVTNGSDRAGNQVSSTDPAGILMTTTYDPLNRPTTTIANDVASPTLPTEDVISRTYYDAAGTTIATTDPKGISTRTIVNVRGLAKTTIANCTDSGTTPTANPPACTGELPGTQNATTNVRSTITYEGSGAAILTVTAVGTGAAATTETAYDGGGRVQAVKDPMGTISRTFYTGDQVTKAVVNCTNSGTTVPTSGWETCTGAGTQDGTYNLTTTSTYDTAGNRTSETAPNGRVTSYAYDDAGRVSSQVVNDVAGPTLPTDDVTTFFFYDDAGRQSAVRAPTADGSSYVVSRSIYDDAGRLLQTIANCTNSGTTLDPALENPGECAGTGTADASTNVVTNYAYDGTGNRTRLVEPDPSATSGTSTATVTTQYAYDDANRLCRVVQNATGTTNLQALADPCASATQTAGTTTTNLSTRYSYDGAGNTAAMIDANGNTTSYGYDAAGRLTSTTDALAKTVVYAYNDLGQRVRQENRSDPPLTASVSWTYDGAGRILTRTANGITTTYAYDAAGNRLTATDGTLTISATYDRLNRPLTVDDEDAGTTADTTYTYALTSPSWTDPTGTYLVTLDKLDRATSVDGPAIAAITTAYRTDGQAASQADPNGNTTAYLYDPLGRESSRTTTAAGPVTRASLARTFNRAGQVLSEASTITGDPTNGTTTYAYDPLERLASFTRASTTTAYGWDEVPNRTSVTVGAGSPVTTTYDAANRPTDQAGVANAYVSDADGRLTTQPSAAGAGFQRYEWDSLGRLTKVKNAAGTVTIATYTYDPLDRLRMADYGGSTRTRFRYVGLTTSAAQIIDDATGTVSRNIGTGWTGERQLDWTGTNSNIRYYGSNAHHDTVWTASSTGTVSATLRYDPWGTLTASTGASLPEFRFQGSWFDTTTSLSWVVTRWYAPALGRFLSEDSLLGTPADPPSRHLYAYGAGEPIGRWDPDGRLPLQIYVRRRVSMQPAAQIDYYTGSVTASLTPAFLVLGRVTVGWHGRLKTVWAGTTRFRQLLSEPRATVSSFQSAHMRIFVTFVAIYESGYKETLVRVWNLPRRSRYLGPCTQLCVPGKTTTSWDKGRVRELTMNTSVFFTVDGFNETIVPGKVNVHVIFQYPPFSGPQRL